MQQWFFFGIALVAILALAFLLRKSQSTTLKAMEILVQLSNCQIAQNQTLMNLFLSKDPMTFQNLQWTTSATQNQKSQSEPVEETPVLDDASMAHALAEKYKSMGWDPTRAYNNDDSVDFTTEFGLNQ